MVPTRDVADFVARPVGRCFVGSSFVMWCAAPDLVGTIHWGVLGEASVRELLDAGRFVTHAAIAPRVCALIDCADLVRVEADGVLAFTAAARPWWRAGSARVERQVVRLPGGIPGILVAGVLPALEPAHPIHFTHELADALRTLAHRAAPAAHAAASAIAAEARGGEVLIGQLRRELARDLAGASLAVCAAGLRMSTRSLQRALRAAGTSFSDELRRARVDAAEQLLLHSDLKVAAIAVRVGAGTSSRVSAMLRRERNVTATELRARRT